MCETVAELSSRDTKSDTSFAQARCVYWTGRSYSPLGLCQDVERLVSGVTVGGVRFGGVVSTEEDAVERRQAGGGPGHEYLGTTPRKLRTAQHNASSFMVARLADDEARMRKNLLRYTSVCSILRACLDEQPIDWRKVFACLTPIRYMFVFDTDFKRTNRDVIRLHRRRMLTYGA